MFELIKRLPIQLEALKTTRMMLILMLYTTVNYGLFKAHYEQTYARARQFNRPAGAKSLSECTHELWHDFNSRNSIRRNQSTRKQRSSGLSAQKIDKIKWKHLPKVPSLYRIWRGFSNVWLCYLLLRYMLMGRLAVLWQQTGFGSLNSKLRPLHCYLIGRFVLDRSFADLMGACLALTHVAWRLTRPFARAQPMALVYFLALSQHDLDLVYEQFNDSTSASIRMSSSDCKQLNWRQRLLYDTMCYRVDYGTDVVLKLRANRTRAAHRQLRRLIGRLVGFVFFAIMLPSVIVIAPMIFYHILLDDLYLHNYPNCDPDFQRRLSTMLEAAGGGGGVRASISEPTPRRLLIIVVDLLENLVVWLDSGITCFFLPTIIFILAYDLTISWQGIAAKVCHLERLCKANGGVKPVEQAETWGRNHVIHAHLEFTQTPTQFGTNTIWPGLKRSDEIYQLICEIYDFFSQVRKLDIFMRQMVLSYALACIGFCAIFTYFSLSQSIDRLSLEVVAIFGALAVSLVICCYGFLMVSSNCRASYTRFCSLMAHDRWKRKHNFETIIEMYTKKKACFTLVGQYPFQATTFLSLIGWTFSCYCLITGTLRHA